MGVWHSDLSNAVHVLSLVCVRLGVIKDCTRQEEQAAAGSREQCPTEASLGSLHGGKDEGGGDTYSRVP